MDFAIDNLMDEKKCYTWLLAQLHDGKLKCSDCGSESYHRHKLIRENVEQYCCDECGSYFNLYTGTVLKGTHYSCCKIVLLLKGILKGQSSFSLSRELKIDRKNVMKIRRRIQENSFARREEELLPDRETESDEMYQNSGEKGIWHPSKDDPPRRRANKKKA